MKIGSSTQRRLACIGDASRYRLVMSLASGPRCVSDLAEAVGLSQSCTTRHLQALQAAGLVRRVRDGKRVMVQLNRDEPEAGPILEWVLERIRAAGVAPRPRSRRLASEAGSTNESRRPGHAGRAARSMAARPAVDGRSGVGDGDQPADIRRPPEPAEAPAASEPVEGTERSGIDRDLDRGHDQDDGGGEGRPIRRPDTIEDYLL